MRYGIRSIRCARWKSDAVVPGTGVEQGFYCRQVAFVGRIDREQPDLTLERAGEMLDRYLEDGGSIGAIVEIAAQALEAAGFLQDHA